MNYKDLKIWVVKTTPENVKEANEGLFRAKMTLPAAAAHCGMTQKEMKLTFFEYLKYHKPDWDNHQTVPRIENLPSGLAIFDETEGGV